MSGEPYVQIETLRVDIRKLDERVRSLEAHSGQIAAPAPSVSARRIEQAAPPSVRVNRIASQAAPPVPPIQPRGVRVHAPTRPPVPPPPPPPGSGGAPAAAPVGQGGGVFGALVNGLTGLLSSPEGVQRLTDLGERLGQAVTGLVVQTVTEVVPELADELGGLLGGELADVAAPAGEYPQPVPVPSPAPASAAEEFAFGGVGTIEYTQTEQTRDTRGVA